ncbi:hypothetical protein MRB53_000710 [Persea americana]|uniref:Uncharacterized protein n=1 Tax=Persea americana TaxID=3435 RepID=A0ACC2MRZ5_PERAE|nr:hypothetical protein MRB53_000710 [Persea americana]
MASSLSAKTTISSAKFEVKKFDGTNNFGMWQCEVRDVLSQQELEIALEDKPSDMKDEEWKKINRQACSTIRLCLAKDQKYSVMRETSAKELWQRLEEKYRTKSLENWIYLKKKLFRFEYRQVKYDVVSAALMNNEYRKNDKQAHKDSSSNALTNKQNGSQDESKASGKSKQVEFDVIPVKSDGDYTNEEETPVDVIPVELEGDDTDEEETPAQESPQEQADSITANIDECEVGNYTCSILRKCKNTDGSHSCTLDIKKLVVVLAGTVTIAKSRGLGTIPDAPPDSDLRPPSYILPALTSSDCRRRRERRATRHPSGAPASLDAGSNGPRWSAQHPKSTNRHTIPNKRNCPQDLEILEGGNHEEDVVGAAVELELLKRGALGGNGGEASFGFGDESELSEIGATAGEGFESNVDIIRREEKLVGDEAGDGVVGVDGEGEEDVGAAARGLGVDGGGNEVDLSEIGKAGSEAAGVKEVPVEELEGVAEAAVEGEPALTD